MQTKKIIITAFAPFGAYPANSSEQVLQWLAQHGAGDFHILPLTYDAEIPRKNRGEMLVARAKREKAVGILSLGMASEKTGLCIEGLAGNAVDNEKYCPPQLQRTAIEPTQEYGSMVEMDVLPWNLEAFQELCMEERVPVQGSDDAGGFCCNHLAYQVRTALLKEGRPLPFLFVHLPCSPKAIPDTEAFARAGKSCLSVARMGRGIQLLLENARFR